ncbi:MAG: DNA translocase FtsK [Chloroflexota bacterium]|nr:DNA translocase FtsK [Chloroflexota bacterium]
MRKKLEFQADRIEAVLSLHKVPARVTGGTVTPRWIRFQVLPAVGAKISKIKNLSEELAAALDASNCRVSRRGAAVAVEVPRDDPQPVRLLPLYHQLNDDDGAAPPVTAVLGLAEDGAPLLIRLPSPDVAHILVAGTTGSGKTVLLQAMILSLAMSNPAPSLFQGKQRAVAATVGLTLMLIDPKGHAFAPFEGLPHLARRVLREVDETAEALRSLVHLMEKRGPIDGSGNGNGSKASGQQRAVAACCGRYSAATVPHVVVVIDELVDLLMVGGKGVQRSLTRLTQRGREVGIHVIAATQKPTNAVLGPLIKANFPVRLVGRVMSANDARTAAGWSGTGAERLQGRGDFVAVAEGRVIRFQAAHVSPEEIREVVMHLAQGEVVQDTLSFAPPARAVALPWPVNRLSAALRGV